MPVTPQNATELFEFLQERFGVGDYDESSNLPYFRYRMNQVSRINSMCTKRRVSIEDLYVAAQYAAERRIVIRGPFDLLKHIAPAKRALRAPRGADAAAALIAAVQEANRLGMTDWAARLYATAPSAATDVLNDFEQAKKEAIAQ